MYHAEFGKWHTSGAEDPQRCRDYLICMLFRDAQQIILKTSTNPITRCYVSTKNYPLKRHFYCWSIRLFRPMCQNVKKSHANFSLTELQIALQALQIQNLQRLNMKMLWFEKGLAVIHAISNITELRKNAALGNDKILSFALGIQ